MSLSALICLKNYFVANNAVQGFVCFALIVFNFCLQKYKKLYFEIQL